MKQLKAVFFDLDGTLIDSEFLHFTSWNHVLKNYNVELSYEDWVRNYAGIPLPVNTLRLLAKYKIDASPEELIDRRELEFQQLLLTEPLKPMPYALEILNFFKERGIVLTLVTSSARPEVEKFFAKINLFPYFKLTITRTDVIKSKPDPESYELCFERLGEFTKDECLVFEDTLNGLSAAKAAGFTCFVVQNNRSEHDKFQHADQIFRNLNEAKEFLVNHNLIE